MPEQKINWDEIDQITEPKRSAIHECLRILAGVCDGAFTEDGQGFNKCDAEDGHELADEGRLTDNQAKYAKKMIFKYHRQLPDELFNLIYDRRGKNESIKT